MLKCKAGEAIRSIHLGGKYDRESGCGRSLSSEPPYVAVMGSSYVSTPLPGAFVPLDSIVDTGDGMCEK